MMGEETRTGARRPEEEQTPAGGCSVTMMKGRISSLSAMRQGAISSTIPTNQYEMK